MKRAIRKMNNMNMKKLLTVCLMVILTLSASDAQEIDKIVYMDLVHGQRMWNDNKHPVLGIGFEDSARIKYMNEELTKSLKPHNARISFLKKEIRYNNIKNGSLLILHVPSSRYTQRELKGIKRYLKNGGALLLVMEADYWTDLDKTNVNDIIADHGIKYGSQSRDTLTGGYTKKGTLMPQKLKVTYELGRSIEGGVPFAYNVQTHEPFGVYKQLEKGGRMVVLGDAMASLYMTEWREVNDYQCREFMQEIIQWLLGK
ncbi:hypothetical protein [uncultured Aquimarina sp.]|uniref:hypothetical protein n=1 Tax=uncultured Aquimarina sp. TaxID=575652 RepID=UPI002615CC98|nr:hypothetical protein [uncultured Aquimarina sp.]